VASYGVKCTFTFTANYTATDNSNWYTKNSIDSTVTLSSVMTVTGTIVTNSMTNSTVREIHEGNLILVTSINRNLKEI
jgi:hypothetical protein